MSGPGLKNTTLAIAIIGPGKIARDQHFPAIHGGGVFHLAACVGDRSLAEDVPCFPDITALRASGLAIDAVAICTPPQVRAELAHAAIAVGWHVLLEKPPAPTLSEAEHLCLAAAEKNVTLLASWHSRFASQVAPARAWLAGRRIRGGSVVWREDVREWHPGQTWLWQPGGLGVFDSGINALSILTEICPAPLSVAESHFDVPSNCATPIAARLRLQAGEAPIGVDFSFLQPGMPTWRIALSTEDGGELVLRDGGDNMSLDGRVASAADCGEYPSLYAHFARLIRTGRSDVDLSPIRLVADAFMIAKTSTCDAFD